MTKIEQNIIDNIININIKRKSNSNLLYSDVFSFILTDENIKWKETESSDLATIESQIQLEKSQSVLDKTFINQNTIKLTQFNFTKVKVASKSNDTEVDEEKTKKLHKVISTFFLERGKNLHLIIYKENLVLEDNINYKIAINTISKEETKTKAENLIQSNPGLKIYWILADNEITIDNTKNVFKLVCGDNLHYLSHPAAYLSNLSLKNEVKDYCYTTTNSIVPENGTQINEGGQKWSKNYLVNVAGKGLVLGGELVDGRNLVNEFMVDMFENKLKIELFNILIDKPKRQEASGIVYNKLTSLCENLYSIGLIETGSHLNPDYIKQYNGKEYVIIKEKQPLPRGYLVHIVDSSDASEEDIENNKMTPITVMLKTQKQIRFINLTMEVN